MAFDEIWVGLTETNYLGNNGMFRNIILALEWGQEVGEFHGKRRRSPRARVWHGQVIVQGVSYLLAS
jgi:hypothetical protein